MDSMGFDAWSKSVTNGALLILWDLMCFLCSKPDDYEAALAGTWQSRE
jgi:hypothetical protein